MASASALLGRLNRAEGARLGDGQVEARGLDVVETMEEDQPAACVHDRDRDGPALLSRFGLGGGDLLGGVEADHLGVEHLSPRGRRENDRGGRGGV